MEMFRVPEKERTLGKKARDSVKSDQKDTFLFLLDKAGAPEARVIVIVLIHPQGLRSVGKDFPGGTVVKNPPANAGDTGSTPGPERSHMPQGN